jgi:flagellar hook-length control protein FliK
MSLPGFQIEQLLKSFLPAGDGSELKVKGDGKFTDTLQRILKNTDTKIENVGQGLNLNTLSGLKGKKFLAGLKKLFLENGMDLENLEANDTALAVFDRLLVSAGFDPKQIESLMQEFKSGSEKKGIRLAELLKRAGDLEEKGDSDQSLDASALPYIESVLSQLLPNPADRQMAWDGVRGEGKGIDLEQLIRNLKEIAQNLPDKGRTQPAEAVQRQVARLMKDLGMVPETGAVTLEKFAAKLEAAAFAQDKALGLGRGIASADLTQMMENIKPVKNLKNGGHPDGAEKNGVASINGDKKVVSLNGRNIAVVDPAKTEAMMQAPKNGPQNIEVPIDEIKSMVTAVSDSLKGVDPTTRLAAEDAKLPVRTLPAYVLNQVSRQMVRSYQNGEREIRLQLNPPNLGRLQMHIDNTGQMLRVQIVAEQQSTQELLLSHAGDLKSILSEQGFRLEKIDVQFDQFFDQSLSNERQESGRSNGRRQRGRGGQMNRDANVLDEELNENPRETEGVLDLVA